MRSEFPHNSQFWFSRVELLKWLTPEHLAHLSRYPRKECEHLPNENGEGWCRCTYVPHINDL
ncbi:hypothetical protein ACT9XH_00895 [Methanococcoides methylutens]|uniref:hypothetical protein n=1 Tax=Methanococcoides methylutens TaxID=2226 RepID=UPI004044BEE0